MKTIFIEFAVMLRLEGIMSIVELGRPRGRDFNKG